MRRSVASLFVVAAVLLAPLSVNSAFAALPYGESQILGVGAQGQEVVKLQADLRVLGYFTYPTNTGYYGEITEKAVKAFQRDHSIEQTGRVGATTAPVISAEAAQKRPTATASAAAVIATAEQQVGTPYQWGGTAPGGFDCSGFVTYVLSQHGVSVPRTSVDMFAELSKVNAPKPGDLVFFSTYDSGASHVGIYLGDDQFISATSSHGVKIDSLSTGYWGARYLGARSVL